MIFQCKAGQVADQLNIGPHKPDLIERYITFLSCEIYFKLTAKTYPVRFIYSKKTIAVHLPKALMINISTVAV